MKLLKSLFARIWAFWGIVTFVLTFLIIFIPSMCSYLFKDETKGQNFFISVSRLWMNTWLSLICCRVKISGRGNFAANKNYVVVFNHNALLDVPLSAPFVPGANKTIAKMSFAKTPLFGLFYKRGAVLVDRGNEKSRLKSFEAMKSVLRKGMHMCIYPEGTRNRTDKPMKEFYDGAFKLARDADKDLIPCVIIGTKKAMPPEKKFYLLPTHLKMVFLPPVQSKNLSTKELKEKVYQIMLSYYTHNS